MGDADEFRPPAERNKDLPVLEPDRPSSSAIRRLTVDTGSLRRRAASEKLPASATFAKTASELRSAIAVPEQCGPHPRSLATIGQGDFAVGVRRRRDRSIPGKLISGFAGY
jgi:hypothetical protein